MNYNNKRLYTSLRENTIFAIKFYFCSVSKSYFLHKLSRFINKKLYGVGFASAINRYDNSLTIYSARSDKKLYSNYSATDKFITFGSGAFFHKRWKNYDYPGQSNYYKSIQGVEEKDFNAIDLCSEDLAIPELDDSVTLIYCSHTLEHLDAKSALRFIKECYRILKKGGVFRVALPNTKNDLYFLRCLINQHNTLDDVCKNYVRDASSHILTDSKALDFYDLIEVLRDVSFDSRAFYHSMIKTYPEMAEFDGKNPDRHVSYWDFDNLIEVMDKVGFEATIPTYQGSSVAMPFCNLHVFDNTEPHIAFYADIIK